MTESSQATLLRRMTRPRGQDAAVNPLTSSRAVRMALTKAANDTIGLVLTVSSVGEETTGLDDMLSALDDGMMLVGLERDDMLVGMIAVDVELRAAILEMQTVGALLGRKAELRAPTSTDKMLCEPLFGTLLSSFPQAVNGTPLEGWLDHISHGARIASARAAGLVLKDCHYRIVTMSVDLGIAERIGVLQIALPIVSAPTIEEAPPPLLASWSSAFHDAVSDASAQLDALLHRFPISLATAQGLRVGSVLNLPGCTVNSVRLLADDGKTVAQAKLGQIGGFRAVRIQDAPPQQLHDLTPTAGNIALSLPEPDPLDLNEVHDMEVPAEFGQNDVGMALDGLTDGLSNDMPAMAGDLDQG